MVTSDLRFKRIPLRIQPSASDHKLWAAFVPEIAAIGISDHAPVLVGHNIAQRDVMLLHQIGAEARGFIRRAAAGVSTVFAHLDADG